jgi:hydroxyquinol 1,2-dioxygenase
MQNLDEFSITKEAIRRIANTANPRLKEVLTSLIQHLHSFAREVALTDQEWLEGIQFLTDTGHLSHSRRQEFILLSDTLGLSMLVIAQNNRKPKGCTEATVFGPFHVEGAPCFNLGDDIANGAKGSPCFVNLTIRGTNNYPIPNATVEVWQADSDGFYDVQYQSHDIHRARGVLRSDTVGQVYFQSVLPEAYPIPTDGPVGRMLRATGRHPWRPAHMHFMISALGYERLVTHVFRDQDQYLDSDAVFGVRSSLIARWDRHDPGPTPLGTSSAVPFFTLHFEFILNAIGTSPDAAASPQ